MFKRFKSFLLIAVALVVLVGGNQFVSKAAIEEGAGNNSQVHTYEMKTDEEFLVFYGKLLEQWDHKKQKPTYKKYHKDGKKKRHRHHGKNHHEEKPKNVEQKPQEEKEEIEKPSVEEAPKKEENQPENNVIEQEQQEKVEQTPETETNYAQLNEFERRMFDLTNEERVKHGLKPFELELEVSRVAREKSNDMAQNRYFDHNSPVYGSPFDMMRAFGITYRTAGENIAMGQRSPEEVVQAWMNSPGHRANILNPNFTHLGVGFVDNGYYWTQQFIGK
ncbi:MAG TPA: CAP domain-containing protein [Pseudogracilibacillus sp.]|nr:CAP domain-containing protein [Pseudogracilibacillus sp.]